MHAPAVPACPLHAGRAMRQSDKPPFNCYCSAKVGQKPDGEPLYCNWRWKPDGGFYQQGQTAPTVPQHTVPAHFQPPAQAQVYAPPPQAPYQPPPGVPVQAPVAAPAAPGTANVEGLRLRAAMAACQAAGARYAGAAGTTNAEVILLAKDFYDQILLPAIDGREPGPDADLGF